MVGVRVESRWALLVPNLFLLALLGFFVFVAGRDIVEEWRFSAGTTTKRAVVVGKEGCGRRKACVLVYRFDDANGETFVGRDDVERAKWRQIDVGASIAIEYFANDPNVNRVFLDRKDKLSMIASYFLMGIFLAPILLAECLMAAYLVGWRILE